MISNGTIDDVGDLASFPDKGYLLAETLSSMADTETTTAVGPQQPLHPPPPPPLPQSLQLTGSKVASPSIASANTTPRQGSKRYTHQTSTHQSDRKNLLNASISKSPRPTSIISNIRDHHDHEKSISAVPLSFQYPKVLVPTTKIKPVSQCSLLCCFYAEFDNTVGPKICYQYPQQFMEQDIQSTSTHFEEVLHKALHSESRIQTASQVKDTNLDGTTTAFLSVHTPKASGGSVRNITSFENESTLTSNSQYENSTYKSFPPVDSSCSNAINSVLNSESSSIFESCSEYIITGNELMGNLINLSTHNIHLVTRPTMLIDETYKRNTLLFSVGFVLRRTIDPHPYHPILSKLAVTLRDMEVESQFLTNRKEEVQLILEGIVRSMNSTAGESNILLGPADVLNLKLFRSPRSHVTPVRDYSVPILVRRDWLHQGYEWDLAINWVSLHIDGIANAKQISKRAEVDFEMVRACLRVLKHHKVVQFIDMFSYSNRYESTERTIGPDLLPDAVEYIVNHTEINLTTSNESDDRSKAKIDEEMHHSLSPRDHHCRKDNYGSAYVMDSLGTSLPNDVRGMKGDSVNTSSFSKQEGLTVPKMKREDYNELVDAIVEFYIACRRDVPIGEVWIRLVTKQSIPDVPSEKINWKKMFRIIDHRRIITYGIIHGFIRRVHNYPLLLDRNNATVFNYSNDYDPSTTPKYNNTMHHSRTVSSASTSLLPATTPSFSTSQNERNRLSSSHHSYQHHNIKKPTTTSSISNRSKYSEVEVRRKHVKQEAAALMDGMHCDDDIICTMETSLDEIMNMFPTNSIVSVYSTNNDDE